MGAAAASRVAGARSAAADVTQIGSAIKGRKKVRLRRGKNQNQQLVITTMTVVIGLGVLQHIVCASKGKDSWLPDRKFWIRIALLGFFLALMSELTPKLGRNFSYLIMLAVLFNRSYEILQCLYQLEDEKKNPDAPDAMPVSDSAESERVTIYTGSPQEGGNPVPPSTPDVGGSTPSTPGDKNKVNPTPTVPARPGQIVPS